MLFAPVLGGMCMAQQLLAAVKTFWVWVNCVKEIALVIVLLINMSLMT